MKKTIEDILKSNDLQETVIAYSVYRDKFYSNPESYSSINRNNSRNLEYRNISSAFFDLSKKLEEWDIKDNSTKLNKVVLEFQEASKDADINAEIMIKDPTEEEVRECADRMHRLSIAESNMLDIATGFRNLTSKEYIEYHFPNLK